MKSFFADTFFFIAALDESDSHHRQVSNFAETNHDFIVTTRWVLAETADALCSKRYRQTVAGFLMEVERDPDTIIVKQSDEIYLKGLKLYSDRHDKDWSLTNCISFVVMKEQGIEEALTGDHHFTQAGFRALFAR